MTTMKEVRRTQKYLDTQDRAIFVAFLLTALFINISIFITIYLIAN